MDNPLVESAIVSLVVGALFVAWLLWPSLRSQREDRRVKPSLELNPATSSPSVKQHEGVTAQQEALPVSTATETENPAEAETVETAPEKVIIHREKLDKLLDQELEKGMARALGLLLGAGYLEGVIKEKQLTEVKGLLFEGRSGRQMSERINPAIRQAEAEGAQKRPHQPEEIRTVTVNGEREIVL